MGSEVKVLDPWKSDPRPYHDGSADGGSAFREYIYRPKRETEVERDCKQCGERFIIDALWEDRTVCYPCRGAADFRYYRNKFEARLNR